jgi:hypothetical protein
MNRKLLPRLLIGFYLLALFMPAYNHWRWQVFQEGYERGAKHTAAYYTLCRSWPADEWRSTAYRFVTLDDDRTFRPALHAHSLVSTVASMGRVDNSCAEIIRAEHLPHFRLDD